MSVEARVQRLLSRDPSLSEIEVRTAALSQRAIALSRELSTLAREAHALAQAICHWNESMDRV